MITAQVMVGYLQVTGMLKLQAIRSRMWIHDIPGNPTKSSESTTKLDQIGVGDRDLLSMEDPEWLAPSRLHAC